MFDLEGYWGNDLMGERILFVTFEALFGVF